MSDRKYSTGQQVFYVPGAHQHRDSGGLFEVVRCQPMEADGRHMYRIRNDIGVERVVAEHQLESVELG